MSSKSIKERKIGLYHRHQTWKALAGLIMVIRRLKIWNEPLADIDIETAINNLSEMSYRYKNGPVYNESQTKDN